MTSVRITKNNSQYRINILNHADDSKVCTACSTLACTFINTIREEERAGNVASVGIRVNLLAPEIIAEFTVKPGQEERLRGMVDTIRIGYAALEAYYPDHVSVH